MASEPSADGQPEVALAQGVFAGRQAFQQIIRDSIAAVAREGWREMTWFDWSYEDWALGERSVEASLQAWSKSGRKLTIVAKSFDVVIAKHHRFVRWRKQWSHIVEARSVSQASEEGFPSLILSPHWTAQRLQTALCRGVCSSDPERLVELRELAKEWLQKSSPAFPATTLGL